MKNVIAILMMVGFTLSVSATNYDKLWEAVSEAQQKDQPRTTMTLLKDIISCAMKDKAYGELLAAQIQYANTEGAISADSLQHHLDKLKRQCETTKDPVMQAVSYAVLAYSDNDHAEEYYDKALASPDLLAATDATAYRRIVMQGSDDAIFNNDMLSVIGNTAGRYQFLKDYYLKHGNRRAACIEQYEEIGNIDSSDDDLARTHQRQMLQQAMKDYADVPERVLFAQRYYTSLSGDDDISDSTRHAYLKACLSQFPSGSSQGSAFFSNNLSYLTQAKFETCNADVDLNRNAVFNIRNIKHVRLDFLRMKADGTTDVSVNTDKARQAALRLVDGGVVASVTRDYNHPDYEVFSDTIPLPKLSVGVYLVKITADELTKYNVIYKTDIALLHQSLERHRHRLAAVSATTGMPLPNATIVLTNENYYQKEVKGRIVLTTDNKGEVVFNDTISPNYVYVSTPVDKAFRKTSYNSYFNITDSRERNDIITVLTDRAIYRPGQKVQGTVIVHNAFDEDSICCVPDKKVCVRLFNPDYEEIYKDSVTTGESGNAGFSTTLPSDGRNGSYSVECTAANAISGSAGISVEEYKRPTFAVTGDDDITRKTYQHGDTAIIRFHAETLTQLPLQKAKVVYSITRDNTWFWYCRRHGGSLRVIVKDDTLYTDDKGNVTIPLAVSLPEEGYGRFVFTVTAKVTDATGETHEKSSSVIARRADNRFPDTQSREPVFRLSADEFARDGSPVTLTIKPGAGNVTLPVYVLYTIRSGGKVVEQSAVTVRDSVYTRQFSYDSRRKSDIGRGMTLSYAFVRDGKVYMFEKTIRKPRPDLHLRTSWSTFRDRTQPGSQETWTLRVENGEWKMENGKRHSTFNSQHSTLAATIYDSSLDLLRKLSWSVNVLRGSYYVSSSWRGNMNSPTGYLSCYMIRNFKPLKEHILSLAMINSCLNSGYRTFNSVESAPRLLKTRTAGIGAIDADANDAAIDEVAIGYAAKAVDTDKGGEAEADLSELVRTNLGETAYFTPSLVADNDGNISISFTMPETMTTWRLLGLAHDDKMRYDIIDTTCVATKDIIVKPNVPRFLRQNDSSVFSATVSNTTDKPMDADVIMQLISPATEKVVWQKTQEVGIAANSSQGVSIQTPQIKGAILGSDSSLIYRIAAKVIAPSLQGGQGESLDGEQHIIPLLPELQTVTSTVAFTQHGPGTYTRDISDLLYKGSSHRKLTLQYVEHAVQMILDAVPTTVKAEHNDALCLASATYVMNLFNIADTAKVVCRLSKLQNADGSWSWWEGMGGSVYVTTAVSRLLARLLYQGHGTTETDKLLSNAMPYMMDYISKEANSLREHQKKYPKMHIEPSDLAIDILYINALQTHPLTPSVSRKGIDMHYSSDNAKDIKYLLGLLEKIPTELTIYGKAHSASVLALYGKTKKAKEFLESMKQYSVYTAEAGRYYDSHKAYYSWRNYRIPSEVAAMEAIRLVTPKDTTTIEEMQRWLLHEKRTQRWDTSVNTADAIYAFVVPSNYPRGEKDSLTNAFSIRDSSAVRQEQLSIPADNVFTHTKTTQGTSWGALYIEQLAPLSSITSQGSGFTITREIIEPATLEPSALEPGIKVTVRITINADRDYDMVTVSDNRPACLEPVSQLSGYINVSHVGTAYTFRSGCYREMKDNVTNFYFDRLAKGTHVIDTDYYIDRQGTYSQGTCTVKCTYAPEFSGLYNTQDKLTIGSSER